MSSRTRSGDIDDHSITFCSLDYLLNIDVLGWGAPVCEPDSSCEHIRAIVTPFTNCIILMYSYTPLMSLVQHEGFYSFSFLNMDALNVSPSSRVNVRVSLWLMRFEMSSSVQSCSEWVWMLCSFLSESQFGTVYCCAQRLLLSLRVCWRDGKWTAAL